MGDASGGRSATSPTFSRSTSVRTKMEWQNSQVVCTALDQRNTMGAPQLGQFAAGALMAGRDVRLAEFLFEQRFKVGAGAWPAAEEIQTERSIFGERVAGQMRFRKQAHPRDATRMRELVPIGLAERMQVQLADQRVEERFERVQIGEHAGPAAVRFNDPFKAAHLCSTG